ncbi:hypothetical protein C7H09_16890 [Marinobacter fuscus]|uniref:Uncharacterized protein n=1 Tax=Marinobacter fuscus TaxID=2109942 RepID=A0A2T1K4L9_9GAMM|nr:hypothetical protein [Marinobacter fuscus]PSF05025.1 hypothetical protein C7H09_16890 [Marinobacter fuscus]
MEYDEHNSLLVLISRAGEEQVNLLLRFKDGGQMIVLGREQLFRQSRCSLASLLAATPANTKIKRLPDSAAAVTGTREKGRELSELQWMLAYEMSRGRMLFGGQDTDLFKLDRWPNFTRLPHTDNCLRMTALLIRRATSVTLVSQILKIPIEQVRQFYVAAAQAGYTSTPHRSTAEDGKAVPVKTPGIIASLLQKLRRS